MDAAAMGRGRHVGGEHGHDEPKDEDHDCAESRRRFSPEGLSTGSMIVEVQRKQAWEAPPDERGVSIVLPYQLSERHLVTYDIVHAHPDRDAEREPLAGDGEHEPLFMVVLGTPGTGKSSLVNTRSHLLGPRIRRVAPTGMSAFLVGESTLHSLLKLPIKGGRPLQG